MRLSTAENRLRQSSGESAAASAEAERFQGLAAHVPGSRSALLAVLAATALGVLWGAPIVARMIGDVDFPFHLKTAEDFLETGWITMPHFLLQVLLGAFYAAGLFGSLERAGVAVFTLLYGASAGVICWYVLRAASVSLPAVGRVPLAARPPAPADAPAAAVVSPGLALIGILLAVSVLLAAPILPDGEEDLFLIGYFPPNVYHNPTMLIAKPLLVLTLMSAVAALVRVGPARVRELLLLASPIALLSVAKPNYLGCLAPSLLACGALNVIKGERVSWTRLVSVGGTAVAAVAATLLLYRWLAVGAQAGIIYAPLVVIANYADTDAASIARSLLASLAFPVAVTVLWPRAAWHDVAMQLAWLGTAVGLFFSYFLAEAGSRMYDGNFLWTGQMAVFVLFVAAAGLIYGRVADVLKRPPAPALPSLLGLYGRLGVAMFVLWEHVASGLRHVQIKVAPADWLAYWT